jgi:hypothetical protein
MNSGEVLAFNINGKSNHVPRKMEYSMGSGHHE